MDLKSDLDIQNNDSSFENKDSRENSQKCLSLKTDLCLMDNSDESSENSVDSMTRMPPPSLRVDKNKVQHSKKRDVKHFRKVKIEEDVSDFDSDEYDDLEGSSVNKSLMVNTEQS